MALCNRCTEKRSETRVKWLACLHLLQEYLDELDATINGPAAYSNRPGQLSERDWELPNSSSDTTTPP
ncbi:hypothetical protein [Kamptonema formosum]|uniref:hypothetical protein n=1 Tax=Kamptonema formosum TaxID=331992 RepID=UPI00035C813B|nr:hypothetical protein [Oscillatoria sp. PCC 10802]